MKWRTNVLNTNHYSLRRLFQWGWLNQNKRIVAKNEASISRCKEFDSAEINHKWIDTTALENTANIKLLTQSTENLNEATASPYEYGQTTIFTLQTANGDTNDQPNSEVPSSNSVATQTAAETITVDRSKVDQESISQLEFIKPVNQFFPFSETSSGNTSTVCPLSQTTNQKQQKCLSSRSDSTFSQPLVQQRLHDVRPRSTKVRDPRRPTNGDKHAALKKTQSSDTTTLNTTATSSRLRDARRAAPQFTVIPERGKKQPQRQASLQVGLSCLTSRGVRYLPAGYSDADSFCSFKSKPISVSRYVGGSADGDIDQQRFRHHHYPNHKQAFPPGLFRPILPTRNSNSSESGNSSNQLDDRLVAEVSNRQDSEELQNPIGVRVIKAAAGPNRGEVAKRAAAKLGEQTGRDLSGCFSNSSLAETWLHRQTKPSKKSSTNNEPTPPESHSEKVLNRNSDRSGRIGTRRNVSVVNSLPLSHSKRKEKSKSSDSCRKRNLAAVQSYASKSHRSSGALPDIKDKHACPTGRHPESRADKPCVCNMVKMMVIAQSDKVLNSWHILQEPEQARVPSRDDKRLHSSAPIGPSGSNRKPVSLPNFQLTKPTKMVRGGQGTVAWVRHTSNMRLYALKFKMREDKSDSTWEIERREARLLRQLKHDFVVQLYHVYETKETIFMALELLEGGCLWNHIARIGPVSEAYALYYAACILVSLRYLHSQQIIYRDMKAENIVLDSRGRPKLIDFGMAKRVKQPPMPSDSNDDQFQAPNIKLKKVSSIDNAEEVEDDSNAGDYDKPPTRYYFASYLAPEIYDHDEVNSYSMDSWGLGYIITEMTLGYGIFLTIPWEKDRDNHLANDWSLKLERNDTLKLSPACKEIIYSTLVRSPEDRLPLHEINRHRFFARVPWSKLARIRGPDLSKNTPRDSKAINTELRAARTDVTVAKRIPPAPDSNFIQEFIGSSNYYTMAMLKNKPNYYATKRSKLNHDAIASKAAASSFLPAHTRNQNAFIGPNDSRSRPRVPASSSVKHKSRVGRAESLAPPRSQHRRPISMSTQA